MIECDDNALVEQSRHGNVKAFAQLVEKYQKTVFNVAYRMTRDGADAEDVAQATFIKAHEKLHTFDQRFRFFSWLYRIATNEAINFLKLNRHHQELNENVAAEDEGEEDREREQDVACAIQDCLMELKVAHRAVVVLKHFQGLSYAEIGEILEISEQKVKSRLYTARMILKGLLMRRGIRGNG
jgi:RNA polymerase sigma-70 factor (ECF subfamily)